MSCSLARLNPDFISNFYLFFIMIFFALILIFENVTLKYLSWDVPGSPVVETLCFPCRGHSNAEGI